MPVWCRPRTPPWLALPIAFCAPASAQSGDSAAAAAVAATAAVPAQELTLQAALALALEANPSLRATLLDAVAARETSVASRSSRQPTFVASTDGAYNEAIAGTSQGAVRTRSRSLGGAAGLRYTTSVGTVLSLDVRHTVLWREVNITPNTSALVLIGPTHTAQATLSATQPLIRGAGRDAALGNERTAAAQAVSEERSADDATSQLVVDVLSAYWELWYAERALEVDRASVVLSQRQLDDAERRGGLGTLAPADALRFATEHASRVQAASASEVTVRSRALELGRLLAFGGASATAIHVGVAPPPRPELPSLASMLDGLVRRSPALAALAAGVEASRAQQASAVDGSHPRLDLTGSLGVASLFMQDAYAGLRMPGGRPAVIATAGLSLELPLVSSIARAQRAAATASLDAAELRYAAEVARAEATIATRHEELRGALATIELADRTAELATRAADAERGRNAIGTSTPTALLEAQQSERQAALASFRARVDAELASARLAHSAGRLLERFDADAPEGGAP